MALPILIFYRHSTFSSCMDLHRQCGLGCNKEGNRSVKVLTSAGHAPISFLLGGVHLPKWSSSHCGIDGMVERWQASGSFCDTQCSVCGWTKDTLTRAFFLLFTHEDTPWLWCYFVCCDLDHAWCCLLMNYWMDQATLSLFSASPTLHSTQYVLPYAIMNISGTKLLAHISMDSCIISFSSIDDSLLTLLVPVCNYIFKP